jgi:chromosome segregation ATPase
MMNESNFGRFRAFSHVDEGQMAMTDEEFEKIRIAMREVIAPMQADITEVKADITGVKADIAGVKADITEVRADITGVKADITEVKADIAEVTAVQAEQTRDISLLRQDVTQIRNFQMGQEVKLDDIQDYFSRIAEGVERLRPPALPPLGEGRITEIRQMHSQINAVERKMAEFQARIEVLEGSRMR